MSSVILSLLRPCDFDPIVAELIAIIPRYCLSFSGSVGITPSSPPANSTSAEWFAPGSSIAILMDWLNQLFSLSSAKPAAASSVGTPSVKRIIIGALLACSCKKPPFFLESLSLSILYAFPIAVKPDA